MAYKSASESQIQIRTIIPYVATNFGIAFNVDWNRGYGHISTFNLTILGVIRIIFYKNEFEDHAGSTLQIHLFGVDFEYENRDIRHWDYDNDCWEPWE